MKGCSVCGQILSKTTKSDLCRPHSEAARKRPCAATGCDTPVRARFKNSMCPKHNVKRRKQRLSLPDDATVTVRPGYCVDCEKPVDRPAAVRCDACVEVRHQARLVAAEAWDTMHASKTRSRQ